jgi:AraC family transcriptional regulator of adaptative response / DNA-3-methyladenine glycosylase II
MMVLTAMELDWQVCSRARLSRDARFDGKFFIAVLTSRVYCRSICPAPTALEKNCRYYPSAAAAAEAGFRPCLRCRPECSPGTPAWLGTPSTVSRALRLIAESGLADGGVDMLAQRLGVGSRHLRRLFLQHLGATPSAVAQTRRLHFAKKLIDETRLPMTEIALASGFGCVRRFNAAIRKVYRRTPTQIRRISRMAEAPPENEYFFRLRFRPPYDWRGILRFLEPRAIPGVEAVDAEGYRRTISLNGNHGWMEVTLDAAHESLAARVQFGDPRSLFLIVERIRAMFDLNADWAAIAQGLAGDPVLAQSMRENPGLRVPGCWNGFELAVGAILGQQTATRLVTKFGQPFAGAGGLTRVFPSPDVIGDAKLASLDLGADASETISALARAVCEGRIRFEGLIDAGEFVDRMCEIRGMKRWTAQYVAMRALGEPDAFPSGDTGLQRRAESWRPWRAYASMYLWMLSGAPREIGQAAGDLPLAV